MQNTCELVERAKAGDRDAIVAIVERFERAALVTDWSILGDFHIAEDVAQDSFVTAFRELAKLQSSEAFSSWLMASVRRNANRRRQVNDKQAFAALPDNVPARSSWQEEFFEILPMLRSLPAQEREVIELRYLSALSVKEVAEATGRPIGTVTKQISRAINRLQELVKEIKQ